MLRSDYKNVPLPLIFQFAQMARELSDGSQELISLEQGQAEFRTPEHIRREAQRFINNEPIHYTAIDGTIELKAAISAKYKFANGLDIAQNRISVGTGGSQIIFEAFAVTLEVGDEVIVPTPYWPSFVQGVQFNRGIPVFIKTSLETNFKIDARQLENRISPRTKWLILNSPGNPAGNCYSENELKEICTVLDRHPNILIMCDEIYEHMIFDDRQHVNILNVRPDFKDRVLLINGVSKSYSMTGWRLGFGCGPVELITGMKLYRSSSTSSPSAVSQAAATVALKTPLVDLKSQAKILEGRRNNFITKLNSISSLECGVPDGGMFVFPRCEKLIGAKQPNGKIIKDDIDFCKYLIIDAGVSSVPGTALGLPGYFRMNFAVSEDLLSKAAVRIAKSIARLL